MKSIVSTLDNGSSDLSAKKKGMDRTMKAIVTVIGKDQVGITASVCPEESVVNSSIGDSGTPV